MKEIEPTETMKLTTAALEVINHLLKIPAGEQIYHAEIKMLFKVIHLVSTPMYVTEDPL